MIWWPEAGVGFLPVVETLHYDGAYLDKYRIYEQTTLGKRLTAARVEMVLRHYHGMLIDVGIGSGAFLKAWRSMGLSGLGYDVNLEAVEWLRENGLYGNPYLIAHRAITLWDVMEHIEDFPALLSRVTEYDFIAMPIYRDAEHVLASKHFRPNEHLWYFTGWGLIRIMERLGWSLVERNTVETQLGREDIESFAFRRSGHAVG